MAAGFAVRTETDGSIICPGSMTGLVGLKPTVGLVPRTPIVPISHSQDIAGPMTQSVRDAAILLSAMIGSDPADPTTKDAATHAHDYAAALDPAALKGLRIGYYRNGAQPELLARFDAALAVLKGQGAELVPVTPSKMEGRGAAETIVLRHELKADLSAYLASTDPARVKTRTLLDLIAFNSSNARREMPLFGQETFEAAQATQGLDAPEYKAARATSLRLAGREGIDAMLADNHVALIVTPATARYGHPTQSGAITMTGQAGLVRWRWRATRI